jgi:hypothetical protein
MLVSHPCCKVYESGSHRHLLYRVVMATRFNTRNFVGCHTMNSEVTSNHKIVTFLHVICIEKIMQKP